MGCIFGFLPFNNDKKLIIRALNTLSSTGKLEIYTDNYIGIGYRSDENDCKLAVDKNKGHAVLFNGQIYNIKGLKGVDRVKPEAESILTLYDKFQEKFPIYIQGDFAIVVWDPAHRRLLLVRDRFGERTLYYSMYNRITFFSTGIKPILQYEELPREPDFDAINCYFSMGYPPSQFTGFKRIFKVQPGHVLVIRYEKDFDYNISDECYWNPVASFKPLILDEDQAAKIILNKIVRSISIRLKENHGQKVGVLLSGGLDSATIASLLKKFFEYPNMEAFTISYGVKYYDELEDTIEISEHLDIPLNEYNIEVKEINEKFLSTLTEVYEEPFANPSAIAAFNAFKLANGCKAKIIFTGDGGDEAFLGYRSYYWKEPIIIHYYSKLSKKWKRLISKLSNMILEILNKVYASRNLQRITEFFRSDLMSSPNPEDRFVARMITGYFKPEELRTFINPERFLNEVSVSNQDNVYALIRSLYNQLPKINTILRNNVVFIKLSLTADVFKVSRPANYFNLDLKMPFLDQDLIETALRLPLSLRIRNKTTKYILRKALLNHKLLPPKIIKSGKKRGFEVPLEVWMKEGLKDLVYQIIFENSPVARWLNEDKVRKLFSKNDRYSALKLWNLLMLAEWYNTFIVEGSC